MSDSPPDPFENPKLDYAPPPSLLRRRSFARWIILLVLALALVPAWRWGPQLRQRVRLFRNQWACLHFDARPGAIAVKLAAGTSKPPQRPTVAQSTTAPPWISFYSQLSPPGMISDGTAFVHERTSPAGHRRLVGVDLNILPGRLNPYDAYPTTLTFATKLFDVGLFNQPRELRAGNYLFCTAPPEVPVTIYYGQADPKDPSHFTIQMTAGEITRIIDGWLLDDDRLVLELREPDAPTPPVPPLPASSP